MPWNLDSLNPAVRFYWEEYDKDVAEDRKEWVELRIASNEDNRRFYKELGIKPVIKNEVNPISRRMEAVEQPLNLSDEQQQKFNNLVNDFCIFDWHLLTDTGDKIPCTLENKIVLMNREPRFYNWVESKLRKLRESLSAEREAEIKN